MAGSTPFLFKWKQIKYNAKVRKEDLEIMIG